jgi:hypothetical protein
VGEYPALIDKLIPGSGGATDVFKGWCHAANWTAVTEFAEVIRRFVPTGRGV